MSHSVRTYDKILYVLVHLNNNVFIYIDQYFHSDLAKVSIESFSENY